MMLLEPAFGCAQPAAPELLAKVLAQLYSAFPPGTDLPREVQPALKGAWKLQPAFEQ